MHLKTLHNVVVELLFEMTTLFLTTANKTVGLNKVFIHKILQNKLILEELKGSERVSLQARLGTKLLKSFLQDMKIFI